MECPKCSSPVYDNRAKKLSGAFKPNAPDFKCSQKTCNWVQWPPKDGAPAPFVAPSAPQALHTPPPSAIADLFWASFDDVLEGLKTRKLTDFFKGEDIVKLVATQFIGRKG